MPTPPTAAAFVERLTALQSAAQREKYGRYFKLGEGEYGEGDEFIGVPMGQVFALAKEFIDLPPAEIEVLLESPVHEARAGAMSIMDKQARRKKTPEVRRKELFNLYLRRIDRINNWDLVDLGAPFVVGGYLFDKPRDRLSTLARSPNLWGAPNSDRQHLLLHPAGDLDDTFRIAEMLLRDEQNLIHKAVGGGLRYAGMQDCARLLAFLDQHSATMPRTALRYAIEHLDEVDRKRYMGMWSAG